MDNGKGTAKETELLAATEVAELVGVKETTVYRWCKQGKLPCLKVGKHWRIRREALEDLLKRSERPVTLAGQLDSFLREPDSVLAIAQNIDILHRLDAAFFRVGQARGGLLVKFYAGEEYSEEELLARFEQNGLEASLLEREGRLLMRPEEDPLGEGRGEALGRLLEESRQGSYGVGLLQLGEARRLGDRFGTAEEVDRTRRRPPARGQDGGLRGGHRRVGAV